MQSREKASCRREQPAIRNVRQEDVAELGAFLDDYRRASPEAKVVSAAFYLHHPGMEGGKNLFCATEAESRIVGLALILPVIEEDATDLPVASDRPLQVWTVVLASPRAASGDAIRGALLDRVLARVAEVRAARGSPPVRLSADMMVSQEADVDYLLRHGFRAADQVLVMQRPLAEAIVPGQAPAGITVRHWRMPSEAEQRTYLRGYNACFPQAPQTLAMLQFLLRSSTWASGMAVAAFSEGLDLVGSVLAYVEESRGVGMVDDVFVLPPWRGRGLARYLVAGALEHLREQGATMARLEVRAANAPALAVYRTAGFAVIAEEVILERLL